MKRSILGVLLGLAVAGLLGVSWNGTYEAIPAGTDLASDLDIFIQSVKTEIRQHAEVEHLWGGSTDDNGLHAMGSARAFVQNAAPTDINGGTAALGQYNSAASADGGTALTTDEIGPTARDIGAGRIWIDSNGPDGVASNSDDNKMMVWDETANTWVDLRSESANDLGDNLIYNGSFEVTDGTGDTTSVGVALGWTDPDTATFAYDSVANSTEGDGVAFEVIANVGANEAAAQTLAGLKESTVYVVRARVRPVVGTCDLVVTGGAVTPVSATSAAASGVFETLEVVATTTAGPADLIVRLESNLAADECDWDHVTAFEQEARVDPPGVAPCFDSDTTTATDYGAAAMVAVPGLSCAWVPPSPGWNVVIDASVLADNDCGQDVGLEVDLLENGAVVAWGTSNIGSTDSDVAGDIRDNGTTHVHFVRTNPTPGTTLTYTLQARAENCGNVFSNDEDNDSVTAFTPASTLSVVPMPSR